MEDGIIESLIALDAEEPDSTRSMFVFPLSLMDSPWRTLSDLRAARCGEVARVSRPPPDERER